MTTQLALSPKPCTCCQPASCFYHDDQFDKRTITALPVAMVEQFAVPGHDPELRYGVTLDLGAFSEATISVPGTGDSAADTAAALVRALRSRTAPTPFKKIAWEVDGEWITMTASVPGREFDAWPFVATLVADEYVPDYSDTVIIDAGSVAEWEWSDREAYRDLYEDGNVDDWTFEDGYAKTSTPGAMLIVKALHPQGTPLSRVEFEFESDSYGTIVEAIVCYDGTNWFAIQQKASDSYDEGAGHSLDGYTRAVDQAGTRLDDDEWGDGDKPMPKDGSLVACIGLLGGRHVLAGAGGAAVAVMVDIDSEADPPPIQVGLRVVDPNGGEVRINYLRASVVSPRCGGCSGCPKCDECCLCGGRYVGWLGSTMQRIESYPSTVDPDAYPGYDSHCYAPEVVEIAVRAVVYTYAVEYDEEYDIYYRGELLDSTSVPEVTTPLLYQPGTCKMEGGYEAEYEDIHDVGGTPVAIPVRGPDYNPEGDPSYRTSEIDAKAAIIGVSGTITNSSGTWVLSGTAQLALYFDGDEPPPGETEGIGSWFAFQDAEDAEEFGGGGTGYKAPIELVAPGVSTPGLYETSCSLGTPVVLLDSTGETTPTPAYPFSRDNKILVARLLGNEPRAWIEVGFYVEVRP